MAVKRTSNGRPVKNHRLHEIMRDKGCSRPWAYVLLKREQLEDRRVRLATKKSEGDLTDAEWDELEGATRGLVTK
jgi:hypothetical protein